MMKTPLDRIIKSIASSTRLKSDEIYVFYVLNTYGELTVKDVLNQSKNRKWHSPIPNILDELKKKQLVSQQDDTYSAVDLDVFYDQIKDKIDLTLEELRLLKDFI